MMNNETIRGRVDPCAPIDVEQTANQLVVHLNRRGHRVPFERALDTVAQLADRARITTFIPTLAEKQLREGHPVIHNRIIPT